jgi:hypothetical protein
MKVGMIFFLKVTLKALCGPRKSNGVYRNPSYVR